jgi:hypothetical protein
MERVISIEHRGVWTRDEHARADRLRDRRAAEERCERTGLLRRCSPVPPGTAPACCIA